MWYGKAATILFFIAIVLSLLSKGIPELSVITIYAFLYCYWYDFICRNYVWKKYNL